MELFVENEYSHVTKQDTTILESVASFHLSSFTVIPGKQKMNFAQPPFILLYGKFQHYAGFDSQDQ